MKISRLLLILNLLASLLMLSCQKVDEAPETSDPVFADLRSELEISTKQEIEIKTQVAKDTKAFRETPAQTGLYTLMRNKMSGSQNLLTIVEQQRKFFEIKLEQRKIDVQSRYQESLKKDGRPWPDEKEIKDYKIRMKLQRDKFKWDTKNVPRGTDIKDVKNSQEKKAAAVKKP